MAEKQQDTDTKKENVYLKAILAKYEKDRYKSLHFHLSSPTNGNIRNKIVSMLQKGGNADFENALKGFLGEYGITNQEELIDKAYKCIEKYRAIQRLLLGKTVNRNNNIDLLHLTAFLVELEKEKEEEEESTIVSTEYSISISNIESGEDTNISIVNKNKGIAIDKIKSGKNTNLDI